MTDDLARMSTSASDPVGIVLIPRRHTDGGQPNIGERAIDQGAKTLEATPATAPWPPLIAAYTSVAAFSRFRSSCARLGVRIAGEDLFGILSCEVPLCERMRRRLTM